MSQESVEAAYRRKLASNPDGEMDYITLQISHPLLSKTYYLVRGLGCFLKAYGAAQSTFPRIWDPMQ